jgi:hypothetical protein
MRLAAKVRQALDALRHDYLPPTTFVLSQVPVRERPGTTTIEVRRHLPGLHLHVCVHGYASNHKAVRKHDELVAAGYECWQDGASNRSYRRWLESVTDMEQELTLVRSRPRSWTRRLARLARLEPRSPTLSAEEMAEQLGAADASGIDWNAADLGFTKHATCTGIASDLTLCASLILDWEWSSSAPRSILSLTASAATRLNNTQRTLVEQRVEALGLSTEGTETFMLATRIGYDVGRALSDARNFLEG